MRIFHYLLPLLLDEISNFRREDAFVGYCLSQKRFVCFSFEQIDRQIQYSVL